MTKHMVPLRKNERAPLFGRGTLDFPVHSDFERLFNGFFGSVFDVPTLRKSEAEVSFNPGVNILESEGAYNVELEVPGMTQDELDVTLADGVLSIRGEKQSRFDEDKGVAHVIGCSYGSFEQRIPLRAEVDADAVQATVKDGVLTITLPKRAEEKEKVKKIDVFSQG